jgi:hypothetical protein
VWACVPADYLSIGWCVGAVGEPWCLLHASGCALPVGIRLPACAASASHLHALPTHLPPVPLPPTPTATAWPPSFLPCPPPPSPSEIILRPYQFCNLTEVVVREGDTPASLGRKVRLATLLGTFQSTLTTFPYLRDVSGGEGGREEEREGGREGGGGGSEGGEGGEGREGGRGKEASGRQGAWEGGGRGWGVEGGVRQVQGAMGSWTGGDEVHVWCMH